MSDVKELSSAKLEVGGHVLDLPCFEGTENERSIDIRKLRSQTGMITYDPGFANTGACRSDITFINGEEGILRHRGYAIDDLAENCEFVEIAYLLVHGTLPNLQERRRFSRRLTDHSLIHEDMINFFNHFPDHAHPMAVLSSMMVSLSTFYPELETESGDQDDEDQIDIMMARLLSKIRTIAAFSYKKAVGEPFVYPRHDLRYCENFLNMMFSSPVKPYEMDPEIVKAINQFFILHADHEQNCSTTAVRLVASSKANLYAAIASGICALWGPLHGGANQAVIEMLEKILQEGESMDRIIERAKDKNDPFRLMGFGHRVYKAYDPRAKIAKKACTKVIEKVGTDDPLLDIAMQLEERALNDDYFVERNLYPNVDFYTGITLRMLGFPTSMYTVMFAIGRLPGWLSQWRECWSDSEQRIGRPRQIYTGPTARDVVPIDERP